MARLAQGELVLGRYRLESRLGAGASAEVWLATDERLGRKVALKILHAHLLPDAVSRERFVAEARAVAHVRHPGIVGIHDVVADDEVAAIVFEHVPGETLEARLRRTPPPTAADAAGILAELADALAAAHAAGVVHRDVKPANVLLSAPNGRARLVDFGVARALEPATAHLTRTGEVVGTLSTMAPEQLAGEETGPAADLYALGVVLYQLLAGRLPFDAPTPAALVEQQRRPIPPLSGAPQPLAALARRLLSYDPAARPASAAEVAAFLRGWLEGVEGGSGSAGGAGESPALRSTGIVATGPTDPTLLHVAAELPRPRRSRRRVFAVPLALAALVGLLALALAFQSILPSGTASTPGATTAATSPSLAPSATPAASPSPSTPPPTPSPTPSPTPTPSPSPVPLPTALTILAPPDGSVVSSARVDVDGEAPPGAKVTHDVPLGPDDHTNADELGQWSVVAILHPGDNTLTFRLGDDRSTDVSIHVTYLP